MYRPLGQGDVDVPAIVGHLWENGYGGWYTLEQDTILIEEPRDEGPLADVRTGAEYLRRSLLNCIERTQVARLPVAGDPTVRLPTRVASAYRQLSRAAYLVDQQRC
jgi:hypothetical protein